ncbi:hypothetical protein [Gilvimarinus polysaccharolyticus]|uniref:hypothetical protein n=1 Tax=Gilvimarinus polysaccharolyticus TaxID=863921 RepID=UPI0006734803|nr:hypothetical protein [Gilvimarinus polysaccharolyticus]
METKNFLRSLQAFERDLLRLQQVSLDKNVTIIDPEEKLFNRIGVIKSLKMTNTCIYLNIEVGSKVGLYRLEQLGVFRTPLH